MQVGEGRGDVDRKDGVAWVVIEQRLGKFMEFFGACCSANGTLVWFERGGDGGCDVFGDSAGDDST